MGRLLILCKVVDVSLINDVLVLLMKRRRFGHLLLFWYLFLFGWTLLLFFGRIVEDKILRFWLAHSEPKALVI